MVFLGILDDVFVFFLFLGISRVSFCCWVMAIINRFALLRIINSMFQSKGLWLQCEALQLEFFAIEVSPCFDFAFGMDCYPDLVNAFLNLGLFWKSIVYCSSMCGWFHIIGCCQLFLGVHQIFISYCCNMVLFLDRAILAFFGRFLLVLGF